MNILQKSHKLEDYIEFVKNANLTDKYKHAYMNCTAAQYGKGGNDIAQLASNAREFYDIKTGVNEYLAKN